jgi:hypothetical protein
VSIVDSTSRYERWLGEQIAIVADDLEYKHERMGEDAFTCFRGTYYRWLERVLELAPDLDGPRVGCVGDLHVENFGSWRDAEGRQVWGVNDFDESEELPYTFDLARLAVSAALAIEQAGLRLEPDDAGDAILEGYTGQLDRGGRPFVLAGRHRRLADLVADALPDPGDWWEEMLGLEDADAVPPAALEALEALLPDRGWRYDVHERVAGVGSLGHRRVVVTGDRDGAPAARELKELSPPAGRWLGHPPTACAEDAPGLVRSPDALRVRRGGWLARRIAPDCVKLDLDDLGTRARERRLYRWMGAETANIHLGSRDRIAEVRRDLEARPRRWLQRTTEPLLDAARSDFRDWRRHAGR